MARSMEDNPKAPYFFVYEDEDILVVYKKRGVLTIATDDKKTFKHNLDYYLSDYLKKKKEHLYLVHRLDVDTSGLLIFAKNPLVQAKLKKSFEERTVKRDYEAVIKERIPLGTRMDITQYLLEDGKTMQAVSKDEGKEAITHLEAVNYIQIGTALHLGIETGRHNQIRLALASKGLTLIGDTRFAHDVGAKRMYLNAYRLEFPSGLGLKQSVFLAKPLWILPDQQKSA
jgi:23S rRNA pseudouridine1911/1915/1917 synthase